MCDYCGCRAMPVIEGLSDDHERLSGLARKVRRGIEASDRPEARARLEDLLQLLRVHSEVEEASLYPALRDADGLDEYVDALLADHDSVWETAGHLDEATWDKDVLALLNDIHCHISREEYDLFPAALLAISPSAWDDVEAAAAQVRRRVV
jgi:hemerythrin-like domain-containing protein